MQHQRAGIRFGSIFIRAAVVERDGQRGFVQPERLQFFIRDVVADIVCQVKARQRCQPCVDVVGIERLGATVFATPVVGELLLALFGLIPNCSVSVVITEAYLSGIIGLGGLFAGLLSNAGIGLLVLLRTNKDRRENLTVIALLFLLGAVSGMLINLVV